MNRIRLLAIGTVLTLALTARAQQTTPSAGGPTKTVATVEVQLKVLTEKLGLSSAQQAKIKPILQELRDATAKVVDDQSLSREERMAKVGPWFYGADRKMRAVLSEDQKKKLDQYEQEPHPEMHGDLDGGTAGGGQDHPR